MDEVGRRTDDGFKAAVTPILALRSWRASCMMCAVWRAVFGCGAGGAGDTQGTMSESGIKANERFEVGKLLKDRRRWSE